MRKYDVERGSNGSGVCIKGTAENPDTGHAIFSSASNNEIDCYLRTTWSQDTPIAMLREDLNKGYFNPAPASSPRTITRHGFVAYVFGFSIPLDRFTDAGGRQSQFHHVAIYRPEIGRALNPQELASRIQKAYIAAMDGCEFTVGGTRTDPVKRIGKWVASNKGNEDFTSAVIHLLCNLRDLGRLDKDSEKRRIANPRIETLLDLLPKAHLPEPKSF